MIILININILPIIRGVRPDVRVAGTERKPSCGPAGRRDREADDSG